jgi:hypothetical protein
MRRRSQMVRTPAVLNEHSSKPLLSEPRGRKYILPEMLRNQNSVMLRDTSELCHRAAISRILINAQNIERSRPPSLICRILYLQALVLSPGGGGVRDAFFGQPAKCDVAHTSLPIRPSKVRRHRSSARRGLVAPKPETTRPPFIFGTVLAAAVTILVIMMWADRDLAEPIPPTEVIYQPQHLNLY